MKVKEPISTSLENVSVHYIKKQLEFRINKSIQKGIFSRKIKR